MQKLTHSIYEKLFENVIAFFIAMLAGAIIYPMYGFRPPVNENAQIVIWFTIISFARGLIVRRFFNFLHMRGIL
jgi:hypothetical protein